MDDPSPPPVPSGDPPPAVRRLPGVGHQLVLRDEDGEAFTAARRKDGSVELHHGDTAVVLPPDHAAALGALASGRVVVRPDLLERTSRLVGGLDLDWITVPDGAAVSGRSIEDVAFRRRTGTTIVAILRGSVPIVDPDPDVVLQAGDDLVIAGRSEDRHAIEQFLVEGR